MFDKISGFLDFAVVPMAYVAATLSLYNGDVGRATFFMLLIIARNQTKY